MIDPLFTDSQFEQLADEVRKVLSEIGYFVGHEKVKTMALKAGCRESAAGRVLFNSRQIDDLRARLLRQYPLKPEGPASGLVHPRRERRTGFGNITPKFYNYVRDRAEGGSRENLIEILKFAQAEPRIASITLPLSRQDVAPEIEQLESVLLMARATNKPLGEVDATVPEAVPFLAEMGNVLGHEGGEFTGRCNCINPPLRLEERTAETMLQRSRYHVTSMITSMPSIGGSGPVDIHAGVVLGTAEIVGGLILSMIIDPEAPLLGYIACTQIDMRTGNATSSTPQTVRLDAGVWQLMEKCFGGGTRVGGRAYITAKRPGLQAVVEQFLKSVGYASLVDGNVLHFVGAGNLDNGSVISPEQFILSQEIGDGLDWLTAAPVISPPGDAAERLAECIRDGQDFLTSEHTLAHFRDERWDPAFFQYGADTPTEKAILDQCHAYYMDKIQSYTPGAYPDHVIRDLEKILAKAKQFMHISSS